MGYYVPYKHTIPLWDMETDYYLHNFHVKTGKGTLHSMKGYQRTFGVVEWEDDDDGDFSAHESPSITSSKASRHSRPLTRSATSASIDSNVSKQDGDYRIDKVRRLCRLQNQALSSWWKIAVQANIQQRMWMQLSRSPAESLLPPRFERLYQPEKMAQFDRFFARSWATPVRRVHPSEQNESPDEEIDFSEFRRNISGRFLPRKNKGAGKTKGDFSLQSFVASHGFGPLQEPSLKKFLQHHKIDDRLRHSTRGKLLAPWDLPIAAILISRP